MSAERVEKFLVDSQSLLASKNNAKILSEIRKLSVWLQKHQSENIPEAGKTQLMSTIESYYSYYINTKDASLLDLVTALVDDCLKLPEGKLITSKSKKKALKWLGILSGKENETDAVTTDITEAITKYVVIDIDKARSIISIMNENSTDDLLEIKITKAQFKVIQEPFQQDIEVTVALEDGDEKIDTIYINNVPI